MKLSTTLLRAPWRLFLVDGAGALLSAFLLGVVLVHWQPLFGIPTRVLYLLASFPVVFALFDAYSYRWAGADAATYLRIIAGANLAYCLLSIGLAIGHWPSLTLLGWAYLLSEIAIVIALASLELRTAARLRGG